MISPGRIDSFEVMHMKRHTVQILSAVGLLVLIFDAQTALEAARAGISLCLQTLIPSLWPFFVFSILLTSSLAGQRIKLLKPLERLCKIPRGSGSLLAVGLLGGYPVGAQTVSLAHKNGTISRTTAERMLGFCNNAGPSFLFGVVGASFSGTHFAWLLWGIHILSTLAVGFLLPGGDQKAQSDNSSQGITLPQALDKSIRVMASVCGWVVFLRIILAFLERWILWLFPIPAQIFITGLLELSNGCLLLQQVDCVGLRLILAAVMLSFGGFCVAMQTRSVSGDLSLRIFFQGKLMQTLLSFLLACTVQPFLGPGEKANIPAPVVLFSMCLLIFLSVGSRYGKKAVAIRKHLLYN